MPSKTSEVSLTSRLKDTEKRISGLKGKAEEMETSVRENVKAKISRHNTSRKSETP